MGYVQRAVDSHKGENGRVAVIGGSRFIHGAPLFAGLAALETGVDILAVCLPSCHAETAKTTILNAFVHPFDADELTAGDVARILELLATMDAAVIGPGIGRSPVQLRALEDMVAAATCRLVLDATALQPWTLRAVAGKSAVLTPHLGELERMGLRPEDMSAAARDAGATIVLKGMRDRIAHHDGTTEVITGGNPGLTAGGTGDALAGVIAGLCAQGVRTEEAARTGCFVIKRAGEELYPEFGYAYGTRRVIGRIAPVLHAREC